MQLDGTGQPYITLAQLLKHHDLVESGGEAKHRVRAGGIQVNGSEEVRPGRKLHTGDRVLVDGRELTVTVKIADGPAAKDKKA
jgi:ribosome-associated protein